MINIMPERPDIIISIHAAQEGCDNNYVFVDVDGKIISIHAAQEGCDHYVYVKAFPRQYFNPRSPRGLRQMYDLTVPHDKFISIHAAQEGCDRFFVKQQGHRCKFQSTQPKRAATGRQSDAEVY